MAGRRVHIVGSVLVRNEDVFVEQAIRNIAAFCDRIHVVDHVSDDGTWEILRTLSTELEHMELRRSRNSADAHRALGDYAGTLTWVLGVDGDELYDPSALSVLREQLIEGAHRDVFRVKAHVLNCDELDRKRGTAHGYLAPPSRPVTKLFNFAAVESWTDCVDPLQAGRIRFRDGFDWESRRDLAVRTSWETDPLRCLHVCFLRRSTREEGEPGTRKNLDETREFRRGALARALRTLRPPSLSPQLAELEQRGLDWKRHWYARGERVAVDVRPFLVAS